MEKYYLGIDIGTSSVKLIVIDEDEQILSFESVEHDYDCPEDGWSEIDPNVWYDSVCQGLDLLSEQLDLAKVCTLGFTGQMHTTVFLDAQGQSIRPAIMWNDTRTKELVPELQHAAKSFEEGDLLSEMLSTGSPASNLFWLKKNEPETLRRLKKFVIGPDYLVAKFTGHIGTDFCEASTSSLFLHQKRKWSDEMLRYIGLDRACCPQPRASLTVAGTILPDIAQRYGFKSDTKVIVGTGDNPATAVSTGCIDYGYPVISLGTSGIFIFPVKNSVQHRKGKPILLSFEPGQYINLIQGAVQSNGSSFDWLTKDILQIDGEHENFELDNWEPYVDNSLLFYPHLMGDKTIYADPDLRGAFLNLSTHTTRHDLVYSVLEGLSFSFRELAEAMGLDLTSETGIKVVGGGAQNDTWLQLLANTLDTEITKIDGVVGAALGVALMCLRSEMGDSASTTNKHLIQGKIFKPKSNIKSKLNEKYKKYKRIHQSLQYINS